MGVSEQSQSLTTIAKYATNLVRFLGCGRRCPVQGAEGARDRVLAQGLETLGRKDCRKLDPLERLLRKVTEGACPQVKNNGQSLR